VPYSQDLGFSGVEGLFQANSVDQGLVFITV
jgi:hypothetical protein